VSKLKESNTRYLSELKGEQALALTMEKEKVRWPLCRTSLGLPLQRLGGSDFDSDSPRHPSRQSGNGFVLGVVHLINILCQVGESKECLLLDFFREASLFSLPGTAGAQQLERKAGA
jgi:hypothetical protein